jgi:hypothetical protein
MPSFCAPLASVLSRWRLVYFIHVTLPPLSPISIPGLPTTTTFLHILPFPSMSSSSKRFSPDSPYLHSWFALRHDFPSHLPFPPRPVPHQNDLPPILRISIPGLRVNSIFFPSSRLSTIRTKCSGILILLLTEIAAGLRYTVPGERWGVADIESKRDFVFAFELDRRWQIHDSSYWYGSNQHDADGIFQFIFGKQTVGDEGKLSYLLEIRIDLPVRFRDSARTDNFAPDRRSWNREPENVLLYE